MGDLTPRTRVKRILALAVGRDVFKLSDWERTKFLTTVAGREVLTEKQEKLLREIEVRYGI